MSRRTASSRKANALRPRMLAIFHRAIEPLEFRRMLTGLTFIPISGPSIVAEDGSSIAGFYLDRHDIDPNNPDDLNTLAYTLTGAGAHPADPAEVLLSADSLTIDPVLHTLSFNGGTASYVHLSALQDDLYEPDEELLLTLYDPNDLQTPLASVTATIKSDDGEIWIDGGGTMNENGGQLQFSIHREDLNGAIAFPSTVTIRLKSAGHGDLRASLDDYAVDSLSGAIAEDPETQLFDFTFESWMSTRTLYVNAIDDQLAEGDEWLKIVLVATDQPNLVLSQTLPTQAFGGIIDDEIPTPPAAPSNLTSTPFSDTAVTLSWQDNSTDEAAFLVQQSIDGVNWSTVQVLDPDITTTLVDNLDPNTDYAFRLRAENAIPSFPSDFTPPLPASTGWQNVGDPLAVPITTTGESPIWLNNGEPLVAGEGYRLVYSSGGVNYSSQSPPNTWTAASYAVRSEDWNYMHWQNEPNGFPFVSTLAEVPAIANDLTWSFTSPGAPMALYFNAGDPQYFSGPGVTWQLQKQIPHVSVALNNGDHATEGDTTPLHVTLTRDAYFNEPLTVHYTLTPNTAEAEDINIPQSGTITIPADSFSVDIPLLATDDSTPEWTENLQFQMTSGSAYFVDFSASSVDIAVLDNNDSSVSLPTDPMLGGSITDPLYAVQLSYPQNAKPGASITLSAPVAKVNVWDSSNRDHLLLSQSEGFTKTWDVDSLPFGNTVYLEVIDGSEEENDIVMTMDVNDDPTCANPSNAQAQGAGTGLTLRMRFNGLDVDDGADANQKILVGRRVTGWLDAKGPTNWSIDGYIPEWAISDGEPFYQWVRESSTNPKADRSYVVPFIHEFDHGWKVDWCFASTANSAQISVSVTIEGHIYNRSFTTSVAAPTVTQTALTTGTPTLASAPPNPPYSVTVLAVTPNANSPDGGFFWKNTVTLPSGVTVGYAGAAWNYLQIVKPNLRFLDRASGLIRTLSLNGVNGLDSVWPAPNDRGAQPNYNVKTPDESFGWSPGTTGSFQDRPGTLLYDAGANSGMGDLRYAGEFRTYIMFNPGGPRDEWVPLQFTDWSFDSYVRYDRNDNTTATPPFVLLGGWVVAPSLPQATSEHPSWDHNVGYAQDNPTGENRIVDDADQSSPVFSL